MEFIKTLFNTTMQAILEVGNTRQSGRNAYAPNGGDNLSCNLPTSQRPDADVDDMMSTLSQGSDNAPISPKANDGNTISEEEFIIENQVALRSVTLQHSDDSKRGSTEQSESLLSVSPERSLSPDIDQTDEEACTSLYKATSKGQLEGVEIIENGAVDPNIANEDGRRSLHVAPEEGHLAFVKQGADVVADCYLGQTALHAAMHNNKHLSALFLTSNRADIYKRDNRGRTPLHMAAAAGNIQILQILVDETCDINVEDDMGLTVLHHAMRNGNSNIVNYLLEKGAEETPYGGDSLIFASASFGNLDLVKLFISRGGDVNEENSIGQNPLHVAALKGYLDITKYLVQEGCDMNKDDHEHFTPVHGAVLNGHLDVLDYLITHQAKITKYDGKDVMHLAAIHGHLDILLYFVKMGADASELYDSGQTLHMAAGRGHLGVVKYLIEHGSKIDKKDPRGYAPLHIAAAKGHLKIVKYLIDQNYSKEEFDNAGLTPLALAAKHGHLDTVKYLADGSVDETASLYGAAVSGHLDIVRFFMNRISLHLAASHDDLDNVQYLVQQGFDINSRDEKGWTPLVYAVQNNNCEVIDYLITNGAKTNQCKEESPLYMASRLGHLEAVNILISRGVSVNAESHRGQIPLHAAAATGRIQVVEALIENGSDLNKTDIDGWTPLHAAIQNDHLEVVRYLKWKGAIDIKYKGMTSLYFAAQHGHFDIVKHLNHGLANVNDEDNLGRIPLHGAVMKGDIELIHYLVEQGSDMNKGDFDGWTPMHEALQSGNLFILQYLIENGSKVTKYKGMTPLYIASLKGNLEIINLLLSNGTDVNEENGTGRIPLHAAAINGSLEIVQKLVNHGSDVKKMTDSGWTPLHAAVQSGRLDVVQYLISHGATNTKFEGTVHYIAAVHGCTHLVNNFVTSGSDVNEGTNSCKSPLLVACYNSHKDSVKKLFLDILKWTPVHAAAQEEHSLVVTYLLANGADTNATDTDGTELIPAEEDACREDVGLQQFVIWFGAEMHDEPQNSTVESCPEVLRGSWVSKDSVCDRLSDINGKSCYPMPLNATKASISTQNPRRTNPDILPRNIKTTIRPPRFPLLVPVLGSKTENDAVDPKPGTKTERRNKENCFSIPALLHRAILALVFYFSCFPILVAGNLRLLEPVTLEVGTRGVVTFYLERPSSTLQFSLFYEIQFGSKGRPFCINGQDYVPGFKDPSQVSRFTTTIIDRDTSLCVNMTIDDVDILDGDQYIFIATWRNSENAVYDTLKKKVVVQRPPGRADCFITLSDSEYPYEVHCWAKTGSMPTTLTCYQNDWDLVKVQNITHNGHTTRAIFLLSDTTHFSCCSHVMTSTVGAATCNDFEWPPSYSGIPSTEKITSRSRSANRSTYRTPAHEGKSNVGSGACKPFMIPPHLNFIYLFLYLVAFLIVC